MKKFLILSLMLILLSSFVSADLLLNLTAYYTMDDLVGSPTDSLGVNNGTDISDPIEGVVGKISTAYFFTGNDAVIFDDAPFDLTDTLSVGAWYNGSGTTDTIASKFWDGSVRTYELLIDPTGKASFLVTDTAVNIVTVTSATAVNNGTFVHLVGTYNGSHTFIYLDGRLSAISATSTNGITAVNSADFTIGAQPRASSPTGSFLNFMTGTIDEVGIWNRNLSALEVAELYNNGTGLTYPFTPPPPPDINITLLTPTDNQIINSTTTNFTYNIIFSLPLANCSLYLNTSGVFAINQTN